MPWIRTVPAEEATAQLKQLFEEFKIERGRMFTPYEVMTNNGPGLAAVANAIVDALAEFGVEHIELPATAERI